MTTRSFTILAMDCPAEEAVIRRCLGALVGVTSLSFDLLNQRLTVDHTLASDAPIVDALTDVGMAPEPAARGAEVPRSSGCGSDACEGCAPGASASVPAARAPAARVIASRGTWARLAVAGALAFGAEAAVWAGVRETAALVVAMALASIALGGLPTLRKGLTALRTFTLNINLLMSTAVLGAAALGQWPEAAVVVFLFAVAELIEAYSLERARRAVRSLMTLSPDTASVKGEDGAWRETESARVTAGATVRVRPGERLPLDGVVTAGASSVDQAPITGESVAVAKGVGDTVFAGSINGEGLLEFRTTGGRDDTTLARIVRSVQEAQAQRAPTQRFVDRFAQRYTPAIFGLATLVAVLPPLLFHQPLSVWVSKALVLLVIACPCALVISTPLTIVSGLAVAARRGILVKGGVHLEQGRALTVVALDKTGTITEGRPRLVEVVPLVGTHDEVLRLAASLDAGSDHPVARAVTAAWSGGLDPVEGFAAVPGRGVRGRVGGEAYALGNHRFVEAEGACGPGVEAALRAQEAQGRTAAVLMRGRVALAVLAVADVPRETSVQALRELHALGVRTVLLSGDNQVTAEAIARAVGIDDARGELLPEEKRAAIEALRAEHGSVGMVGDGVNDAPALAAATVGFAMGAAGTDTAMETADVALMRDDLRSLPEFIRLSRRTAAILKQNLALAIGSKAVFFVLALLGVATMWMAVLADMGATLVVVANGLRLVASDGPALLDPHRPAPTASRA
ncbi:MAG: heavy metal translocating P-type ATPase [Myxococcaceae bacterium]|nr:MAG: heavy metal translocating P-type ATPase [Myxococcaceae bacterium]